MTICFQWPNQELIPGFRETMENYLMQIQALCYNFIPLLAEALGLPSDALAKFYDSDDLMQHRGKGRSSFLKHGPEHIGNS